MAAPTNKTESKSKRSRRLPSTDCSAVPVIVDPEYSRFVVIARLCAREGGYALAIHGSMNRDLDLIAVPWVDDCNTPEHLIQRIEYRTGCKTNGHPVSVREHGRLSVVFMIAQTFGDPRYVDFSIIPPQQNTVGQATAKPLPAPDGSASFE